VGRGLFTTTRDLQAGTSRQSHHIPGTATHVPSTAAGAAGALGLGRVPHDSFHSKTNLSHTFNTRMPGYGGHVPTQAPDTAPAVQLIKGQFAPTEALAASHVIHRHWHAAAQRRGAAGGSGV